MNRDHHVRMHSALIGRADEVRHLELCWSRAKAGEGNVVVISGEAGIGKSRLALDLENRARIDDPLIMRLQCSASRTNSDLHPIHDHLVRFAGIRPAEAEDLRYAKIQRLLDLSSSDRTPERLLKGLVAIGRPATETTGLQSPRRQRDERLGALADGFADLAAVKPLLLILEDAQWLDPTSDALLARLVQQAAHQRLLIVVTARREYDPNWIGLPQTSVVLPRRLTTADALTLAKQTIAADDFSPEELQSIVDRSEGVPFFVEELSREKTAIGAAPTDVSSPPGRLQALLMARLNRLGPAKRMAQVASALGRRFSHEIGAHVWGGTDAAFEQMIEQLMAAEILRTKPIRPGSHYSFRHALFQEAAYASLARGERAAIHARIVEALAAVAEDHLSDQPEILAHHSDRAELHMLAASQWLAAGKASAARGSVDEAINHFKLGLDSAGRSAPGPQRERLEFELNMNLGPALMALSGYASGDGLAAFAQARRSLHCSRSSLEEIHVLLGLFNVHFGRGDLSQALDVAKQADQLLAVGYGGYPVLMGQTLCMMGQLADARRCLQRALAIYDPTLDTSSGLFCRADVVATSFLAKVEFSLGNLDRSSALTQAAMDLAREQGHPVALAIAYLGQLFLATEAGDLAHAHVVADEALAHVTQHNLGNYRLWVAYHRAALSLRTDPSAAIAAMHQILAEADAAGTLMFRPAQLGLLGAAYASIGRSAEALDLIDQGLATARTTGGMEAAPALLRLRAKTLAAARPGEALQDLETSLEMARQQSARIEELRSATVLARMLKDTDRRDYAKTLLAGLFASFTQGHHFPDLKQAGRVLAMFEATN